MGRGERPVEFLPDDSEFVGPESLPNKEKKWLGVYLVGRPRI